jgi:hypothetical protein
MENKKSNSIVWLIIISFLLVPLVVSVVSTIHVINFFALSNGYGLALTLALAFEIGALSALAGLVALGKINKNVVWFIFLILTFFQMMGNTYYAYDLLSIKMQTNPDLIRNWTELFGLLEEDQIMVKRIISILSGAILPIVSLSFLDLLVDYIRKTFGIEDQEKPKQVTTNELTEEQLHELSRFAGQIEKQNVELEPQPKYENLDKIEEYLTNLQPKEEVTESIQELIEEQTPNEEVVEKNNEQEPIKRIVYHRQNA